MTESIYAASPVSRFQLRNLASSIRIAMGLTDKLYLPVAEILEQIPLWFEDYYISCEIRSKEEMGEDTHGYFDFVSRVIVIREDVYEGACEGNGRDRMTIVHEICHFILLVVSGIKFERRFGEVKPYEDPEWQAKALAGELMMPADKIRCMNFEQIAEACGVSCDAAMFQFNILRKERSVNTSN